MSPNAPIFYDLAHGSCRGLAVSLARLAQQRRFDMHALRAGLLTATLVHRHQRRSAGGEPYVSHPLNVALLVGRWGGSLDDVLTALLHDTAEDGAGGPRAMLNQLADQFGEPLSVRVAALTKFTGIADRQERAHELMQRLVAALARSGPGLGAVRLADRLHNCVTSAHFDAQRLQRLLADTQRHMVPLAQRLGLPAVAGFLAAGPGRWHAVAATDFVSSVVAKQPAWLGEGSAGPHGQQSRQGPAMPLPTCRCDRAGATECR